MRSLMPAKARNFAALFGDPAAAEQEVINDNRPSPKEP